VVIGEGVVWYSGQFWALYFIQQVQKPDVLHPALITGTALLLATPSLIFFGWLSDKIGRKPIILAGFFLAAVTYYPLYNALGNAANPANINYPLAILIVAIMVSYVGMIATIDRKSTRLNSSHGSISYAVFCLKKKTA